MFRLATLLLLSMASLFPSDRHHVAAQSPRRHEFPKVIEIELKQFQSPSEEERKQIEQWLLDLDLVSMVADRLAFTATGTYFLGGKGKEKHISNLRQYAIGWSLDHQQDSERLLVVNQQLLNPEIIDQGNWRLMQTDTAQLDRLRIKTRYHEANGNVRYDPNATSQIQDSLERAGVFFPTRAATSSPAECWAGKAIARELPPTTIQRLQGIQKIGDSTVALFEYRPADFYVFFVALAFRDGSPVQYEGWRSIRPLPPGSIPPASNGKASNGKTPASDDEAKASDGAAPEDGGEAPASNEAQWQEERDRLIRAAKRVARVQSKWKKLGTYAVPIAIHGTTLDDFHDIELVADIEWYVNDQVNPEAFQPESLGQLGPLSVANP